LIAINEGPGAVGEYLLPVLEFLFMDLETSSKVGKYFQKAKKCYKKI